MKDVFIVIHPWRAAAAGTSYRKSRTAFDRPLAILLLLKEFFHAALVWWLWQDAEVDAVEVG
jgi:uncharacterized membrane protein